MATKYPLTPDGVKAMQAELYKLDDAALQREAISASADSVTWLSTHFELTADQLDYLKTSPKGFSLDLGFNLASGIVGRRPLSLEMPQTATNAVAGKCKAKTTISVSVSTSYNNMTGATTYTGTVGGSISF